MTLSEMLPLQLAALQTHSSTQGVTMIWKLGYVTIGLDIMILIQEDFLERILLYLVKNSWRAKSIRLHSEPANHFSRPVGSTVARRLACSGDAGAPGYL